MSSESLSTPPVGYTQAVGALVNGNNAAQSYLSSAEQTAQGTDSAYLSQSLGYLNNLNTQAQNTISPQVQASYSALDQYFGLLGINTPYGGEESIANYNNLNTQMTQLQSQLSGLVNQQKSLQQPTGNWQTTSANMQQSLSMQSQIDSLNSQINTLSPKLQQAQQQSQINPNSANQDLQNLTNTPGYQFTQQQGDLGINSSAAAGGYLQSGQTQKALISYNQNLATTTYQNAVNNALQATGLLQQATTQSANISANQGTVGAQITSNTGQAIGSLQNQLGVNQASTVSSAAGGISAIYGAEGAQQQSAQASQQGSQAYLSGFRST